MRDDVDKLALLRAFAEVAIVRPEGWNYDEIRGDFERLRFNAGGCFVCGFDRTQQHHVIQPRAAQLDDVMQERSIHKRGEN